MAFSKSLLVKGIAGVAAAGTVTVSGVGITYGKEIGNLFKTQEQIEKEKKEEIIGRVNKILGSLAIGGCLLGANDFTSLDNYSTTFSKECELEKNKFQEIMFSNRGEENVNVEGWTDSNKVKLVISNKPEVKNGIKFLFKDVKDDLTITKSETEKTEKVTIRKGKDTEFEEKNGRLEKVVDSTLKGKLERVNGKLGSLRLPENCRFDVTEKDESLECGLNEEKLKAINFSNKVSSNLTVKGTVPSDLKIKVNREDENITFTFTGVTSDIKLFGDKSKGKIVIKTTTSEGEFKVVDGRLTKGNPNETLKNLNEQLGKVNAPLECRFDEAESDSSVECDVNENELKKMEFSNKGKEDLTIKGWNGASSVKLKVAKENSDDLSLTFTGITSDIKLFGDKTKGKIIVKVDKKFKVENDKLVKESSSSDVTLKTKLQEFNEQLGKVNAPLECRFDEAESDSSVECDVAPDELKGMVFSGSDGKNLTYTEGDSFTGMKLKLQFNEEIIEPAHGTEDKVMYLTFKDYSTTVKLSKEGGEEVVSFISGTNPEFEIYEEDNDDKEKNTVLKKMWNPDAFENALNLICSTGGEQTQGQCTFDSTLKSVSVLKTNNSNDFTTLEVNNTASNNFELHKDVENFNQGYKFVFKGNSNVTSSDGYATLEKDGEYEFKWKFQNKAKTGYLAKKQGQ